MIRDEAHRFAVGAHRRRRAMARRTSCLENIVGIGPKRRQLLLTHFEGLKGVTAASVEDIAQINQIGHALAEKFIKLYMSKCNEIKIDLLILKLTFMS